MSGQNRRLRFRGRPTDPTCLAIKQRLINLHRSHYASNPQALAEDVCFFRACLSIRPTEWTPGRFAEIFGRRLPQEVRANVDLIVAGL